MEKINRGYGPKIVAIGGGTGLSVLLRGLKLVTDNLTAIVTVSDDGGGSGILREDLGMLAPGDIRSCILALADEEGIMQELLKYRFQDGRLAGQNMGNILIAALNGIYGNFEEAVSKTNDILKVKGRVIPVTGSDVRLIAELENDQIICGESNIPKAVLESRSAIKEVYLEPKKPLATKGAIDAIIGAEIILIGPGSLYTSIISNFLVDGIGKAIAQSNAVKILVCNMMTQPGETDSFTVLKHVEEANKYIGSDVIEYVIANNKLIDENTMKPYLEEGAKQIIPTKEDRILLEEKGITLIASQFADIKNGYIRHDAERIANVVIGLISD